MAENFRPLRVLVIEDEVLIRWSIAETLAAAGHIVTEAEDGATAVRALANAADVFDAVVLDYRLPDSSDLTLLAAIRKLSSTSAVILMTAYETSEIRKGALDLGAFHVLHKPFDLHDLEPLILKACGLAGASTDARYFR